MQCCALCLSLCACLSKHQHFQYKQLESRDEKRSFITWSLIRRCVHNQHIIHDYALHCEKRARVCGMPVVKAIHVLALVPVYRQGARDRMWLKFARFCTGLAACNAPQSCCRAYANEHKQKRTHRKRACKRASTISNLRHTEDEAGRADVICLGLKKRREQGRRRTSKARVDERKRATPSSSRVAWTASTSASSSDRNAFSFSNTALTASISFQGLAEAN